MAYYSRHSIFLYDNDKHLPYRAKAQQILYDHLLEIRKAGKLRP